MFYTYVRDGYVDKDPANKHWGDTILCGEPGQLIASTGVEGVM